MIVLRVCRRAAARPAPRSSAGRRLLRRRALLSIALACWAGASWAADTGHPTLDYQRETVAGPQPGYRAHYAFSEDWFSENIPTWTQVFAPFAGKPNLHYLEIGVYEGRSFFWMLENVLTHPSSRLTAIDIFVPTPLEKRFLDNAAASGRADRITTIKGYSAVELRALPLDSYDIIYIDGSHAGDDVLVDTALCWGLLKNGGILVFDDFKWDGSYYTGPGSQLPMELIPMWSIWAFMNSHRNYFDVVHSGYQMILRKRENPCPNKTTCTPLGDYRYEWKEKKLYRGADPKPVALSESERGVLEEIFWNRAIGDHGFVLVDPFASRADVRALVMRLKLDIDLPQQSAP